MTILRLCRRLALAAIVGALLACASDEPVGAPGSPPPAPPPPPPPPAPTPALLLRPDQAYVTAGQVVQFRAVLGKDEISGSDIAWSVVDTSLGIISPDGRFMATRCFLGGVTEIRAQFRPDTTQKAAAPITLILPAIGIIQIMAVRRAEDQQVVDLERVIGDVDVTVSATAMPCRDIVSLELRIRGAGVEALPPPFFYAPPRTERTVATFRWPSAATVDGARRFPNGEYAIWAELVDVRGLRTPSNRVVLQLRNP